jgi:hypothetical protein
MSKIQNCENFKNNVDCCFYLLYNDDLVMSVSKCTTFRQHGCDLFLMNVYSIPKDFEF